MKITKKIVILTLALSRFTRKASQEWFSYQELYTRVPLEESTIRGITAEFLREDIMERREGDSGLAFRLSTYGFEVACDLFPAILEGKDPSDGTLLSFDRSLQRGDHHVVDQLQQLHAFPIDAHTYIVPTIVSSRVSRRLQRRGLHVLTLDLTHISAASVFLFWKRTNLGEQAVAKREQCQKILHKYQPNHRSNSPNAKKRREVLQRAYAEFISASSMVWDIPDSYYPHDLRLATLIRLLEIR